MYNDYAQCETEQGNNLANAKSVLGASYQPPTARRQLEQKRAALLGELARVEAALSALDTHPDLEVFTETLKAALR